MPIDYGSNNVTTSGNISVSGAVTATSGNFTNLLINGSSFASSVSGLLPTIANSGDNRILTSTGTSVGINAESNLTFNGTSLVVAAGGGLTSPTGNFTTSISGALLNVDNLRLDGNTISSTNNNGNILISPDGTGRVGIRTTTPSGSLHVVGSGLIASVTGTVPNALLHAYSATSGATIFNVEGTNGSLFSVVDNLSGTLMSVNNNAGLPVFEVFSDDKVVAGRFGQNDFVVSSSGRIGIGTSNPSEKLEVAGNVKADNIIHPFLLGGM